MLQPVVERKGCEKVLGDMRDCLVETHCWGKCDEEVQRFQECINTKYFEEIVVEPDVESGEESLEPEGVVIIDEVKSEGVVSTSDESGNELIDGDVKTNEEELMVTEELKTTEEEPVVTEEVKTNEEKPVVTEENTEDDLLDSNVDVNSRQDEKEEEQSVSTDDNAELVDDKEVEVPNDSDITKDDETNTVDKDAFRIRIVSKSEKKIEEDENLLFRVTVKPNV